LAAAVVLIAGTAGLLGSPASLAQSEGWPSLQGGPEHIGEAVGGAQPPLKKVWKSELPGDARLSPVALIPGLAVATGQARVVGLDPDSGRVLWTVPRADGPLGTPAIDPALGAHGVAVFTEGDRAAKSAVAGLDLSTQKRLWTTPLSDVVIGSPTMDGGIVFVGALDRSVSAIDASSGKVLWKRITSGSVKTSPAMAGGLVFVTSLDDSTGKARLAALDVSTGLSRWSYSPARLALGISSVTVGGGRVYVGFNDQSVRAFDAATGRLLWTEAVRAPFSPLSTLAFAGDSVYAVDDLGGVYRFAARTGHRFWDYQFPSDVTWGSPLVAGSAVYVGMDDGTLAAIDVATGHLVWQIRLGLGPTGAVAPAGDLLLVPAIGSRGGIVAFDHDPQGRLVDEPSPTELDLGAALANFSGAFLVMTALILGLFRWLSRRRERRGLPALTESEPVGLPGSDGEET
jgi:outer membrane protein assembly factor BamB